MRKTLILLGCLLVFCVNSVVGATLSTSQTKLRNDIILFLKEEGYIPEIDSDGDVKFKKEGDVFYVKVSATDSAPMYITLFSLYNYSEKFTKEVVRLASIELNNYKGVKVLCFDSSFQVQTDMYMNSSEPFRYAFYKLMEQISCVDMDLAEECDKVIIAGSSSGQSASIFAKFPFVVTYFDVANVDEDNNVLTEYGQTIYDFKTRYLKPRIKVTPLKSSGTYTLNIRLYKGNVLQTGTGSPAGMTYSETVTLSGSSDQTFALSGWGSNTAGNWGMGSYRYEVWSGDVCLGSKTFSVK